MLRRAGATDIFLYTHTHTPTRACRDTDTGADTGRDITLRDCGQIEGGEGEARETNRCRVCRRAPAVSHKARARASLSRFDISSGPCFNKNPMSIESPRASSIRLETVCLSRNRTSRAGGGWRGKDFEDSTPRAISLLLSS